MCWDRCWPPILKSMTGAKIVQVVVEGGVRVWRYWLLSKTGQVKQPPLFLDLVAARNDTNIDPLFWIAGEVERSRPIGFSVSTDAKSV